MVRLYSTPMVQFVHCVGALAASSPRRAHDRCTTASHQRRASSTFLSNEFLTLDGIPPETFECRPGNRSALEWAIDQYQVSSDKRSGITNDFSRPDDPEYILRLLAQVITVSLETVNVVKGLPLLEKGGVHGKS